ncbi:MAG: response regulator [Alphaproteobacteria bacterium]|nr:response regulator [Alphaproteobacteria bacterium]
MHSILVIDDEQPFREAMRFTLEEEGYAVVDAENGRAGIDIYRQSPTDLIITDIIMPEYEGMETILALKSEFPEARIIAMSGRKQTGPASFLSMAEKLGAGHTLTKPFRRAELLSAVRDSLDEN